MYGISAALVPRRAVCNNATVSDAPRTTATATAFAIGNISVALLVAGGVFLALPWRWWVVDAPACLAVVLLLASSVGLLMGKPWGARVLRASAAFLLVAGLALIAALTLAIAFLSGVHGVLGQGVAVGYLVLVAIVVPYLVVFPGVQLVWVHQRPRPG